MKFTECNKCKKIISNNNFSKHQIACNKEKVAKEKPTTSKRRGGNQYTKALRLGLPKPSVSLETKEKIRNSNLGRKHSEDVKRKISESMKKAVLNNPESYTSSNVCGRVKIVEYGGIKFHGSWEVIVAKYFDENNIKWNREVKPTSYFWDNSWHLYYPDFYLPEFDLYVEVKGYETERDRCKWASISNLLVLKKKEINEIKQNIYVFQIS